MYKRALRHNASKSSPVSNVSNKNNYKTKTYICVGCNRRYSQFKSPSQFIKNHMETNIRCKKAIVYCQCCKSGFIDKLSLMSHLNKSNKSCRKFYDQKAISDSIASSFSTSEVIIMSHSDKQSEEILSKSLSTVNGTKHNTNISVGQSMFLRTAVTKHSIKSLKNKNQLSIMNSITNDNNNILLSSSSSSVLNVTENQVIDLASNDPNKDKEKEDISSFKLPSQHMITRSHVKLTNSINEIPNKSDDFEYDNDNEDFVEDMINNLHDKDPQNKHDELESSVIEDNASQKRFGFLLTVKCPFYDR